MIKRFLTFFPKNVDSILLDVRRVCENIVDTVVEEEYFPVLRQVLRKLAESVYAVSNSGKLVERIFRFHNSNTNPVYELDHEEQALVELHPKATGLRDFIAKLESIRFARIRALEISSRPEVSAIDKIVRIQELNAAVNLVALGFSKVDELLMGLVTDHKKAARVVHLLVQRDDEFFKNLIKLLV